MKAGEFLNTLATLSGISSDNDALKTILAAQTFSEVDIPDEIVSKVNSSLMTMESAKNNTELIKHFRGSILGSVDARINDVMNSHASIFTDDVQAKIQNTQSSYDKVTELAKVLSEATKGTAGGDNSEQLKALEGQIATLNQTITELKSNEETLKAQHVQDLMSKDMGYADRALLSSLNFGTALEKKDYIDLTSQKIEQKASTMGLVKVFENGEIKLKKKDGEGLVDYYENNKPVSYSDFAQSVAAEHKYLNVGGTPPPSPANPPAPAGNSNPTVNTTKWSEALDNAASDLNGGAQS